MARGRVGVASSLTVTGELPWSHQHSNRVASGHWRVLGISLAGAWRVSGGCLASRWRVPDVSLAGHPGFGTQILEQIPFVFVSVFGSVFTVGFVLKIPFEIRSFFGADLPVWI